MLEAEERLTVSRHYHNYKGDVEWNLPGKARPFAYSTISDSLTITLLAENWHTPLSALQSGLILSPEVKAIFQGYIDAGHGLTTLEELIIRQVRERIEQAKQRRERKRAAAPQREKERLKNVKRQFKPSAGPH